MIHKNKKTSKKDYLIVTSNANLKQIVTSLACIIVLSFLSFNIVPSNDNEAAFAYVEAYNELAVIEMYRSGIPASITLAQGLHESNNGLSRLAIEANNHFGIKCKTYWQGKTYYHNDDDYDAKGNLIPSCFRSYENAVASFVDHSQFLQKGKNYSSLFNYDRTDYESWAHGLKRCGYATDPNYAQKLLNKIDQFDLSQFDHAANPLD